MKLKVASNYVGTIVIPHVRMVCRANSQFLVEEKVYNSAEIQKLLADKILEVFDESKHGLVEYKNLTKNKLAFSWGQIVGPLQNFHVTDDKLNDKDLIVFIKENIITKVIQKKQSKIVRKTENKKVNTKKNSKKQIDNNSKPIQNEKNPIQTEKYIDAQKIPNTVLIHKPTENEIKLVGDVSKTASDDNIKFVDHEQKIEKINRLQKAFEDKTNKAKTT